MSLAHRIIRAYVFGMGIALLGREVFMQRHQPRYVFRNPKEVWIVVTSALSFLILFLMGLPTLHS